jgi:hypothetical protein
MLFSFFNLTLPDPDHFPTQPSQPTVDEPVPITVALNLRLPERPVLLGQPKTPRASVPEAPIHKHRDLLILKQEIRLARNH